PSPRLALELSGLPQSPLLHKSWPSRLDADPPLCLYRPDSFRTPRPCRRRALPPRRPCFLRIHFVLPGLGRHLFVRQSLLRFADAPLHLWAGRSSRIRIASGGVSSRLQTHRFRRALRLHSLEPRPHVSVGHSSRTGAGSRRLSPDDQQPVHSRSTVRLLAPARVLLPPQLPHAANRRARPAAAQANPAARLTPSHGFSGNLASWGL